MMDFSVASFGINLLFAQKKNKKNQNKTNFTESLGFLSLSHDFVT